MGFESLGLRLQATHPAIGHRQPSDGASHDLFWLWLRNPASPDAASV